MKKVIIGICVAVVILLVAALVIVSFSLDGIVKRTVETVGSKLAKVEVKLDSVKLSPFSGAGQISGLFVGNPEGFKTAQAITVGTAAVSVQPGSLLSDKLVIHSIRVDAPEITLETGFKGTNLKKILDNVNASTETGATNTTPKASKKLQVDDFLISGAKLHLNITGMSGTVPLPEIHLTSLGQGPEGITAGELMKKVLTAIEDAATKAATENAGAIAKGATDLVKGFGSKTNNPIGNVGKGIGDLFKKK